MILILLLILRAMVAIRKDYDQDQDQDHEQEGCFTIIFLLAPRDARRLCAKPYAIISSQSLPCSRDWLVSLLPLLRASSRGRIA
jgi:hypothetical protein